MNNGSTAIMLRVPTLYRGKVLTPSTAWIKNGLFVLQVLVIFGGSFVPGILGVLAGPALFPKDAELSFIPIIVGLGLTGLSFWMFFGQLLRNPWSSSYVYQKTRTEFLKRPDAIVDPNNPDAILVEVIPRRNWGLTQLESAEDQGFLYIDLGQGRILFEGDNNRYQIPVQAVISSEVEVMNKESAKSEDSIPFAAVVMTVRDELLGQREIPLLPRRTVSGDTLGGNYVQRANELQRRISSLFGGLAISSREPELAGSGTD